MTFAPVGIRCPDHANAGATKSAPARTIQNVRRTTRSVAAPATMALVAVNVVVYMITAAQGGGINLPGGKLFSDWALQGLAVSDGDWWRLVTAMFLHGSMLHLLFNMLALFWLGSIVEQALGTPRYLIVYFVSGVAGSAGALVFSSPFAVTVGASGAIFGVMGALLILEYRATGSLAGQAMMLIIFNLAITFAIPGISKGGHLGGLLGGILVTLSLDEGRRRRVPGLGLVLAVVIGVASFVVAYVRVSGYTL
jgi:membrane associated rhomboid family serine protease